MITDLKHCVYYCFIKDSFQFVSPCMSVGGWLCAVSIDINKGQNRIEFLGAGVIGICELPHGAKNC